MATIEQKRSELEDIKTIRFISSALLEISAARMQRLREDLAANDQYYKDISKVYTTVKLSASRQMHTPEEGPSQKVRSVSVAFTSNKRFYGVLNRDVIKRFFERTRGERTDRIIIGTTGREIAEHLEGSSRCKYFSFAKDEPTVEEMKSFLERVGPYERVFLYYPTFVNVFRQNVTVLDVTYTSPIDGAEFQQVDYIFEPELPQIIAFFERQVRLSLVRRVMLEMALARIAARFVAMTEIENNSEESFKSLTYKVKQLENADANRQLLESLASFSRWKK